MVLSKILANRLEGVIHKVISSPQGAVLEDRQMADNILIANELVDEAKRKKIETIMFKVDFDKAFDSIGTTKTSH